MVEKALILLIGVLLGGIGHVVVDCVLLYLRRKAVGRALLEDIRHVAREASRVAELAEEIATNLHDEALRDDEIPSLLVPLWEAALKDLTQLPQKHLRDLTCLYAQVGHVNLALHIVQRRRAKAREVVREAMKGLKAGGAAVPMYFIEEVKRAAQEVATACRSLGEASTLERLGKLGPLVNSWSKT